MEKRQEIELLRIVSAFGIVWFHTSVLGKDIAYSGLIAFLIISMYFSASPKSKYKSIVQRATRLLVPWLFWLIFFGAINLLLKKPILKTDNGILAGLLAGTSIHLWYMPFIFMAVIVFDFTKQWIRGSMLAYGCAFIIIALFATAGLWRPWSLGLGSPWAQYIHALNGVLIGVLFANCGTLSKWVVAGMVLLILAVAAVFTWSVPGVFVSYGVGVLVTALVLLPGWSLHSDLKIGGLSESTFGIYLCHPFWFLVLMKFGISSQWALPCLVFVVSAISIWGFKQALPRIARYVV